MQDQRGAAEQGASGWAHTVGLARRIWLNDEGTDLMMAPIEALHGLEKEVLINASEHTRMPLILTLLICSQRAA